MGNIARATVLSVIALVVVAGLGVAVARRTTVHVQRPFTQTAFGITIDAQRPLRTTIAPGLFGFGVDINVTSYARVVANNTRCLPPLDDAGRVPTLIRIGATLADSYDWQTDSYYNRQDRPVAASSICSPQHQPGTSILSVLDRTRRLGAQVIVVLNGEIDDPQGAAGLVRLIANRYGLAFARQIYWEIGNNPSQWQQFGQPLDKRTSPEGPNCSPDQYAALVTSYAAAISAALDRSPPIIADQWITNATDQYWTGLVTAVDTSYFPFDTPLSTLSAPDSNAAVAAVTDSPNAALQLDNRLASLRANLSQYSGGGGVGLLVGQWNLDSETQATNPSYGSWGQAVFTANVLLHFIRDGISMAAWAPQLYGPFQSAAPFEASADGSTIAPTPAFNVFKVLRGLSGAHLLPTRALHMPSGVSTLAVRLPDGRIALVLTNATTRTATFLLSVTGHAGRSAPATIDTFAPGAANGGRISGRRLPLHDAALAVPGLGVVVLTMSAAGLS